MNITLLPETTALVVQLGAELTKAGVPADRLAAAIHSIIADGAHMQMEIVLDEPEMLQQVARRWQSRTAPAPQQ